MKALTLHQPHAFLVGVGAKWFETRSWSTKFRGLLAIHAGSIRPTELDGLVLDPNAREPHYIEPYERYLPNDWGVYFGDTNHGGIEALVVVRDCLPAEAVVAALSRERRLTSDPDRQRELEEAASFGDFSPGRFAWKLDVALWVNGNIGGVVRGYQRLWNTSPELEETLLTAFQKATGEQICRVCGCTEDRACMTDTGPCHWAAPFLCSACGPASKPQSK